MEYKILSGTNYAESSVKSEEDDMYGEVLERYATTTKKSGDKILKKEDAQEAAGEIFTAKRNVEPF